MTTTTTTKTSDRIQKQTVLKASPARVWRALTSAREFGAWFGAKLDGDFVAGKAVRGTISFEGRELSFLFDVERIEPERLLAFRWHPHAVDPDVDYSQEPKTLVELAIEPAPGGTLLTITESGFDRIPAARRAKAFEMNDQGWAKQAENIARYLDA